MDKPLYCGCISCWQCGLSISLCQLIYLYHFPVYQISSVSSCVLFFKAELKWIQNHSCTPNCRLYPCYINEGNVQKPLLVVFSIRDIDPDEEICFNYQGTYPGDDDDDDDDESDVHEDSEKPKDNIYKKCLCGAKDCKGVMKLSLLSLDAETYAIQVSCSDDNYTYMYSSNS